jgi:hypothetical protein
MLPRPLLDEGVAGLLPLPDVAEWNADEAVAAEAAPERGLPMPAAATPLEGPALPTPPAPLPPTDSGKAGEVGVPLAMTAACCDAHARRGRPGKRSDAAEVLVVRDTAVGRARACLVLLQRSARAASARSPEPAHRASRMRGAPCARWGGARAPRGGSLGAGAASRASLCARGSAAQCSASCPSKEAHSQCCAVQGLERDEARVCVRVGCVRGVDVEAADRWGRCAGRATEEQASDERRVERQDGTSAAAQRERRGVGGAPRPGRKDEEGRTREAPLAHSGRSPSQRTERHAV